MPWEKRFDVDQTLTKAMQAFWARGYEATSMQDLVSATGVNRASLYATYGDKHDLFVGALRKYDDDVRRRLLAELDANPSGRAAICALFDRFSAQADTPEANWGCFMTNSALELAAHDPEIAHLVNAAQAEIEAFLLAQIVKGQASGEFAVTRDAAVLARQTFAAMLGLLVIVRSRPDRAFLDSVRDGALMALSAG